MYAKNYRKRSLFEKVMAKITRCSFFCPQCISVQTEYISGQDRKAARAALITTAAKAGTQFSDPRKMQG